MASSASGGVPTHTSVRPTLKELSVFRKLRAGLLGTQCVFTRDDYRAAFRYPAVRSSFLFPSLDCLYPFLSFFSLLSHVFGNTCLARRNGNPHPMFFIAL